MSTEPNTSELNTLDPGAIKQRGQDFRRLHESGIFVMPCAWDAISALLFQRAGFVAVGTTSGGVNWSHGRPDYVYGVSRDEMLQSYAEIAAAIHLPVSGDLENGYGDDPSDVAACIVQAINGGLVGGSIEDHSADEPSGMVSIGHATEKIAAAREAADNTGVPFTITGRAESLYSDAPDPLGDAIERANRYVDAGADCIFIPGLTSLETIREAVNAIKAPLSVGIGSGGSQLTVTELEDAGVRRISTGGALPRSIYSTIERIGREMLAGDFTSMANIMSDTEVEAMFDRSGKN